MAPKAQVVRMAPNPDRTLASRWTAPEHGPSRARNMLTAASKMMRCQATWEQRPDEAALLM